MQWRMRRKKFEKIPWKEIALAITLFVLGVVFLVIGVAIFTEHIDADHHWPESGKSQASVHLNMRPTVRERFAPCDGAWAFRRTPF